jgi:excisionase family DNA binding protein
VNKTITIRPSYEQPSGVLLAPEECRQLLWSAVRDLDRQQRDDGGSSPAPGYMALLRKLQAAAVARATPSAKVSAEPRQLTTAEAASVMGVSPQRVRQLAADGKIIARKAGRDWQVEERAAQDWRNRRAADGNR